MKLLNVNNEFGKLKKVVLGIANSNGGTPKIEDCYDPKSREHVVNGTFPFEKDLISELDKFAEILEKYNVTVIRPDVIENYNQIFSRDLAFVIENKIIISNIIVDREKEISAINKVFSKISPSNIIQLNNTCRIEGGDVILNNKDIFIGYSKKNDFENFKVARTNESAVNEIKNIFPNKNVFSFELKKSDLKPDENALHLDCCFQPIGHGFAIIYENGFKNKSDINLLIDMFGNNNLIRISKQEMYEMNSNVFSISENIIVSEMGFNRLNNILREKGFIVEEIKFSEIAKMEGLLRCATLPLYRK